MARADRRYRLRAYWLREGPALCVGCGHGVAHETVFHCSGCDAPICSECVVLDAGTGEVLCRACRDSGEGAD